MRTVKWLRAVIALAGMVFVAAASACRSSDRPTADSTTSRVLDDFGTPIVFASPAQRIVSLNPTTTEILFAIGAASRIVGRSKWDSWPDSARFIPALGDALRPNMESVLTAHPDLVLLYA